ncbi:MAG: nickel-responsive transcriptional regulator NikR [Spirochaetales bacterium]|nr:nickel-responsive transcriptional regulator NikR [Spirochaetales bacterium]
MLKRFSISLENDLLKKFDTLIAGEGYSNRSEAVRDLIRDIFVQREWLEGDAETAGVAVLVYDHHRHELSQKLVDVQHHDYRCIVSSLHIHLDEHNCLEVIVLKGKAKKIQKLADSLISTRGVIHGRFIGTTTGKELL